MSTPQDPRWSRGVWSGAFSFEQLRGRRMVVFYTPEDAVRLGMDHLLREGFIPVDRDLNATLRLEGSPWIAQAALIGDRASSWKGAFGVDLLVDVFPPALLIPGLKTTLPLTVVMVTAKDIGPDSDGRPQTELYLMPVKTAGDPSHYRDAAPLIRQAIDAAQRAAETAGALVSADKPIRYVRDTECPASLKKGRALLQELP